MNVVDLLITIVVVTILVTIVLAVITYVAYKLRLARQPTKEVEGKEELRFFVKYDEAALTASTGSHAPKA
jgi:heme/copper-type cytochrome/quinol oxidase subunit 2